MNWDAVGAVGEVFSALALFFVLVQVRHARADTRRSVLDSMANSTISVQMMSSDARVLSATIKAHGGLGGERPPFVAALMEQAGLTEEEARLVLAQQTAQWQALAQATRNVDALWPDDRIGIETNLRLLYARSPVGRLWFQYAKATMNPGVYRYMNVVLAEPG